MNNNKKQVKVKIPEELEGIALTSDVDALEDKVAKSYSKERYEDFQEAVRKITLETIDGAGREKIKAHAKESAKEYSQENGWAKKTFWIPVIISLLALVGAVIVPIWVAFHH